LCDERVRAEGKGCASERLAVSPEEASALTGIGLTSIRGAISSGDLKAKKHGRRTIILPDDLRVWLKALPGAGKPIEQSTARVDING
jgi:Helix-turn-helix domain